MSISARIERDGCGGSLTIRIGPEAVKLNRAPVVLFVARLSALAHGWVVGDGAFRDVCPECLALYDRPPVSAEELR